MCISTGKKMGLTFILGLCICIVSVDSLKRKGCNLNFGRGVELQSLSPVPPWCFTQDIKLCVVPRGTQMTVGCKEGYVKQFGAFKRTCDGSRWKGGIALQCRKKRKECPKPSIIGGKFIGNIFEAGKSVTYFCGPGLRLHGAIKTTCLQSGQWNNPIPTCQRMVSCPDPQASPNSKTIPNKRVNITGYGPTDKVTLQCNPGYMIDEIFKNIEMVCNEYGKWEYDFDGVCTAVPCQPPSAPSNGWFQPNKTEFQYLDTVTFYCKENHELRRGSRRLTCKDEGVWDGFEPICAALKCPDPPTPDHGRTTGSSFYVGDTVAFECYTGFTLRGSDNRTCLPTLKWSGSLAVCEKGGTFCPELGTPTGARKTGYSYDKGDSVTFTCEDDFTLVGSERRVCLKQGVWSGKETFCRYKHSYTDPKEASIMFSEKIDTIAMETSSSWIGSQLLGNLTSEDDNVSTGRALNLGHTSGLDLYFLVDVSGSIDEGELNITKAFCKAIVDKVGVSDRRDGTRVSMFRFAGKIDPVVTIQEGRTPEDVKQKIDEMTRFGESSSTGTKQALEKVQESIATQHIGVKYSALSAVILITDGMHNMFGNPRPVANELKKDYDTDIYTIGVGSDVSEQVLRDIASNDQFLRLKTMDDLNNVTQQIVNGSAYYTDCGSGGPKNLSESGKDYQVAEDIKNWPWMAGLYYRLSDKVQYTLKCGASLIRPQWLLTAAHCFTKKADDPAKWQAKMGSLERSRDKGISLDIDEIIKHPNFVDSPNERNDVALIKLVTPMILTPTIRTVCLPNDLDDYEASNEDDTEENLLRPGRWTYVTGWGDVRKHEKQSDKIKLPQNRLHYTSMRIQNNNTCKESIKSTDYIYDDGMFCAGDGNDKDACEGDSGGPSVVGIKTGLYGKDETRMFQVGIVSWGIGCRQEGKYGFYTRVEEFLPWITGTVDER